MSSADTHAHSEQFIPPFALLKAPGAREKGHYDPLGIAFCTPKPGTHVSSLPSAEEAIHARFKVMATLRQAVDSVGLPPGVGKNPFTPAVLAWGVAELSIAENRLIFLFARGESLVGKIREGRNVLASVLPYYLVEGVSVKYKRNKEQRISVECLSHGAVVEVEQADWRLDGESWQKYRGGLKSVADMIVQATAENQLATGGADDPRRTLLQGAIDGNWIQQGDEMIAQLVL